MGIINISSAALTSQVCNSNVAHSGAGSGVFYVDVELGPNTGNVNITCNPASIPDRYEVFYDGNLVADSKFIGNYFTGNPPDADTALWEGGGGSGQFVGHAYNNVPDLVWNGTAFVASGPTTNFVIQQSDVAPFGSTASGQVLSFNKNLANVTIVTIKVTSVVSNTGWGFVVSCPQ